MSPVGSIAAGKQGKPGALQTALHQSPLEDEAEALPPATSENFKARFGTAHAFQISKTGKGNELVL